MIYSCRNVLTWRRLFYWNGRRILVVVSYKNIQDSNNFLLLRPFSWKYGWQTFLSSKLTLSSFVCLLCPAISCVFQSMCNGQYTLLVIVLKHANTYISIRIKNIFLLDRCFWTFLLCFVKMVVSLLLPWDKFRYNL